MFTKRVSLLLAGLTFILLLSCGRSSKLNFSPLQDEGESFQPQLEGADASSESPDQLLPSALPIDGVQPWEELDGQGFVVPKGGDSSERSSSAINLESDFIPGVERFLEFGNVTDYGEASRLETGNPGERQLAYAIYRISLGPSQPGVVSADVNLRRRGGELNAEVSNYFFAVSDYGHNSWKWFGPFSDSHVRIALPPSDYTSRLGNTFIMVAGYDGASFDIVGIGLNRRDDTDTSAPPVPSGLVATSMPGGVLLEWTPVIAEDLAGYKIYFATYEFTAPTQRGVKSLNYLEGITRKAVPRELLRRGSSAGTIYFAISSLDTSGNESPLSSVSSADLIKGNLPLVNVETDVVSGGYGTIATLTASGAEIYDFDLDGDGTFDITDSASPIAASTLYQPGIIRPQVRGRTADGAISFAAVSLIISVNSRPVASAQANPSSGIVPLTVNFTGSGADDDGTIVSYSWDFDGDGIFDYTDAANPNPPPYTYETPGLYNVKFRVEDNKGSWDVDTISVQVFGEESYEAVLEEANTEFRKSVSIILLDRAGQEQLSVDTDNFIAAILEDNSTIFNAGISGTENYTIDDLASGADVQFVYLGLPQGSELPSGFYVVHYYQADTGEWHAQFRNTAGEVALDTLAEVGFGTGEAQAAKPIFTFDITITPDGTVIITIDWHILWASAAASVRLGDGAPELDADVENAVMTFRSHHDAVMNSIRNVRRVGATSTGTIVSRDDALLAISTFEGLETKSIADFADGEDVFFGYMRVLPAVQKKWLPANFRLARIVGDETKARAEWRDLDGNLLEVKPATLLTSTQQVLRPIFTLEIGPDKFVFDFHWDIHSLATEVSELDEEEAGNAIQLANQALRGGVKSALESASQSLPGVVNTDDFTVAFNSVGDDIDLVAVNAGLVGAEKYTLTDLASGKNMLFLYLRLPVGSEVPSGFYLVRIYQDRGTGIWKAELTGQGYNLVVDANVGEGDPSLSLSDPWPKSVVIECCPLRVTIDWKGPLTSGAFSLLLGDGGVDTGAKSQPALQIERYVSAAALMRGKGIKIKSSPSHRLGFLSSFDTFLAVSPEQDLETISLEELNSGKTVFYVYAVWPHMHQRAVPPAGFYSIDYTDWDGDGFGFASLRNLNGQIVATAQGQTGPGTGLSRVIFTYGYSNGKYYIDWHIGDWSLEITLDLS